MIMVYIGSCCHLTWRLVLVILSKFGMKGRELCLGKETRAHRDHVAEGDLHSTAGMGDARSLGQRIAQTQGGFSK